MAKVDVRGARISAQLDLRHGDITCAVHLTRCYFDAEPDLYAGMHQQLTAAYQRVGDDAATRLVQLAKHRRHRTTLPAYARAWNWAQDITVGYGFRPLRAVRISG